MRRDDVRIEAVAVLGNPLGIEQLEARGDDDVADFDLDEFLFLREVNRLPVGAGFEAGLLALAGLDLKAAFRVNHDHLRHGLRERDVNGLALAQADVEFVRELPLLEDAGLDALLAADAQLLVHVTRLALHGDRVIADVALDTFTTSE